MVVRKTKLPEEMESFFDGYAGDIHNTLVRQFLCPPFSFFDARQGYWQERKNAWLRLGIESELGRGMGMLFADPTAYYINFYTEKTAYEKKYGKISTKDFMKHLGLDTLRGINQRATDKLSPGGYPDPLARARMGLPSLMKTPKKIRGKKVAECMGKFGEEYGRRTMSGTSIFDPVLCELMYRWFCPLGGRILDPFAGGSVRGIVAGYLGYEYVGIDLSPQQVLANEAQAEKIIDNRSGCKTPRWIVGDALDVVKLVEGSFDLIFSCPPYYNLEIYSEDKKDLSNFPTYEDFLFTYCKIVKRSVSLLKENRFACFVVSEIRDKEGFYRNFVGDTVFAFENAGIKYYNEGILLTIGGSLPIRIPRQFSAGRKLGRTHQNILIFYRGDPSKIREELGDLKSKEKEDGEEETYCLKEES